MRTAEYFTSILAAAGAVAGQQLARPSLNYLGFMNLTLGNFYEIGEVGLGKQVTIPITGGTIRGPKINGNILSFSGEYGSYDPNNFYHPDARLIIQTNDGAFIYMQLAGSELPTKDGQPDNRGALRIKAESGHPKYSWLNYVAATGMYEIPGTVGKNTYLLVDAWETKPAKDKDFA
ncbi:hypothetical protein V8C42DRAFT_322774 [Trichoderma barbatum]